MSDPIASWRAEGHILLLRSFLLPMRVTMGRYKPVELTRFRDTSHCSACVHYSGCALWLALLLMNEEPRTPGLEWIVPDITKSCAMFFPWTSRMKERACEKIVRSESADTQSV